MDTRQPGMFSVIMPIWNRAYIAVRAIESVVRQTYPDYELIIVDDGSEDGLEDVVDPYLGDQVIFKRISHSGVCAARNFALTQARGEFIAYLDSDNIWHPDFLSVMGNALILEKGRKKAAYCKYNLFKFIPVFHTLYHRGIKGEPFNFEKLLIRNYIDLNTFIHSRECIETVGFFDEALTSLVDWDYIIRITARYEPLFVPQVLVNYYLNICDNSIAKRERLDIAYKTIRKKNKVYERDLDK
jgi:glycosyltransferase involved in cell wall biosynthesis